MMGSYTVGRNALADKSPWHKLWEAQRKLLSAIICVLLGITGHC